MCCVESLVTQAKFLRWLYEELVPLRFHYLLVLEYTNEFQLNLIYPKIAQKMCFEMIQNHWVYELIQICFHLLYL